MRSYIESSGGRRFVMTVGAGMVASVLQWFGKLDPAGTQYVALIALTVGAYLAANTTQKIKGSSTDGGTQQ